MKVSTLRKKKITQQIPRNPTKDPVEDAHLSFEIFEFSLFCFILCVYLIEIWLIYNIISVSVYSVMHDLVFADNTPFKVITEEWIYFIFKSNASAYLFVELFFTVS